MRVTLDLSNQTLRQLRKEASLRRIAVGELIAELADELPPSDALADFTGCGASSSGLPFEIHGARSELAERLQRQPD